MEWYPHIARAQARVNILNSEGPGWYVQETEGGYAVRHDGVSQPTPQGRVSICITRRRFNKNRVDLIIKAA